MHPDEVREIEKPQSYRHTRINRYNQTGFFNGAIGVSQL